MRTAAGNQILSDAQHSVTGLDTDTLASVESASLSGANGRSAPRRLRLHGHRHARRPRRRRHARRLAGPGLARRWRRSRRPGRADARRLRSTLSDAQLTGAGTDDLAAIESASLSGDGAANSIDASAFTAGTTTLAGLGGADTLDGGNAGDSLDGGGDGDDADGNGGTDTVDGGTGNDLLDGGFGVDGVAATRDADLTLNDTLLAGGGESDTLVAASFESASLTGGARRQRPGRERVERRHDPAQRRGRRGHADRVPGSDTLLGGGDNDVLRGSAGADSISGGDRDEHGRLLRQRGADQREPGHGIGERRGR